MSIDRKAGKLEKSSTVGEKRGKSIKERLFLMFKKYRRGDGNEVKLTRISVADTIPRIELRAGRDADSLIIRPPHDSHTTSYTGEIELRKIGDEEAAERFWYMHDAPQDREVVEEPFQTRFAKTPGEEMVTKLDLSKAVKTLDLQQGDRLLFRILKEYQQLPMSSSNDDSDAGIARTRQEFDLTDDASTNQTEQPQKRIRFEDMKVNTPPVRKQVELAYILTFRGQGIWDISEPLNLKSRTNAAKIRNRW